MAKKTISGARAKRGQRSNGCNPRHNNRDYLPSNADPARQDLNVFFAESTRSVTIEQIYEKLFQGSYEEWLAKEHAKGRQMDAPDLYIDKIRNAGQSRNAKREQYEIIWQIGDMHNTGWLSNREDFMAARDLLQVFAEHLQTLPEIELMTPEKLTDPNWQPKSDCCLIVTNLALHGDEHTPQIHMDFIPYCRGAKRGQKIQNAYAAAFEGMGYAVKTEELKDEHGNPVFKKDKDGNTVYKLNKDGSVMIDETTGAPVPDPVVRKISFGSIDWIENQKTWLAERMKDERGWDREYKGKNKFGDVTISEFAVEDNKRIIEEQERAIEQNQAELTKLKQDCANLQDRSNVLTNAHNDACRRIAAAERRVDYLQSYEEYTERADQIEAELSKVDSALEKLQKSSKFFRKKDADEYVDDSKKTFGEIFTGIKAMFGLVQDYEEKTYMKEEQRRSPDLDERIRQSERKTATPAQVDEYYDHKDYFWNDCNEAIRVAKVQQEHQSEEVRWYYGQYAKAQYLVKNSDGFVAKGIAMIAVWITKADLERERRREDDIRATRAELSQLCEAAANLDTVQRAARQRNALTEKLERQILEHQDSIIAHLKAIREKQGFKDSHDR